MTSSALVSKPMNALDCLLNDISGEDLPADWYARSVKCMLDCLTLIEHHIPSFASIALEAARNYWRGEATGASLEEQRVALWTELHDRFPGGKLQDVDECAARAVLGAMYPNPEGDIVDLLSWFATLANRVEPHESEQIEIVRRTFGRRF